MKGTKFIYLFGFQVRKSASGGEQKPEFSNAQYLLYLALYLTNI